MTGMVKNEVAKALIQPAGEPRPSRRRAPAMIKNLYNP
jgi:hypothetical protein